MRKREIFDWDSGKLLLGTLKAVPNLANTPKPDLQVPRV